MVLGIWGFFLALISGVAKMIVLVAISCMSQSDLEDLFVRIRRLIPAEKPNIEWTVVSGDEQSTDQECSCQHSRLTHRGSNGLVRQSRCLDCGKVWQSRVEHSVVEPSSRDGKATRNCGEATRRRSRWMPVSEISGMLKMHCCQILATCVNLDLVTAAAAWLGKRKIGCQGRSGDVRGVVWQCMVL